MVTTGYKNTTKVVFPTPCKPTSFVQESEVLLKPTVNR